MMWLRLQCCMVMSWCLKHMDRNFEIVCLANTAVLADEFALTHKGASSSPTRRDTWCGYSTVTSGFPAQPHGVMW